MGPRSSLYTAYRDELHGQLMVPHLRIGAFSIFVINTLFIGVDAYLFLEQFLSFLPFRLVLDAILGAVYLRLHRTHPVASKWAIPLSTAGMLLVVVQGTGGVTSEYYVGLILLFTAVPVLLPLTTVEAVLVCAGPLAFFVALGIAGGGETNWSGYTSHLLFLFSAAFLAATSATLLDRVRFRDFVRRKEIERAHEELRELDRAKSRFTANVHHELRTPLTLILAPLEAIVSGELGEVPENLGAELQTMRSNAVRLLKLINDLLELARLEGGVKRLERRPVSPGPLVEALVAGVRSLADCKRIELVTRGIEALPTIQADSDALERILMNLLGNAIKFTGVGGRIEIAGETSAAGVELRVSDTGIGIPADQLEWVFDRFAQVDGTTTRAYEGTGIGLSLARELVQMHGGWIRAESDGPGTGTTMRLGLPTAAAGELVADPVETAPQAVAASQWSHGLEAEMGYRAESSQPATSVASDEAREHEVLVVEDNEAMRALLARLLEGSFRVRTAGNGREALDAMADDLPALVVTDIMMPLMDGTELCRVIKSDPRTRAIPVMLLTSKAEREMKIEGLELGADDYVTKPFHPRELLARVRSLVRMRGLQLELAERYGQLEQALRDLREAEVQLVQSERLAAVGELAAGVAHEINNPVNFAMNALETLRQAVTEVRRFAERLAELDVQDSSHLAAALGEVEKLRREIDLDGAGGLLEELVSILQEGLERTHRLVGDLRDFGRPSQGTRESVDLQAAFESTLRLLGGELRRAGIRVERRYEPPLPRVLGDRSALNQVLLNLLKNAVQVLEERGGTITVGLKEEGPSAVLWVADDGPGIDPEMQAKLFEPFFTTKAPGRGTGLGLSICRRILRTHGGSVDLESAAGHGARFVLRLPREASHATAS